MYKKLHLYIFLTLLITGFCGFAAATASAADADVAQTTTAPTIDGSVDSVWSNANSYSIATVIAGTVSSDSDLSGSWRALWDSTNLYYLVEVTDDALNNDSTDPWDDDSVEIFIDADNSKGTSYDGVNDYQYVFRYNDGTIHLGSNSATNTTGIDFTIVVTANGYTLEVSIPWSTLGVTAAQGNLIGTDVQANDDDDGAGRDGKKAWYATNDNCWQDPSLFATAELVEGAVSPPGQASNLSPADGASDVDINADLSWVAGSGATSHDVYFGDVTSPPFVGNQTATTYDPGTLSEVTTYYWRIDEKNAGGTTTGSIWSFTTAAASEWTQLTYDDFEAGWGSYTDGGGDCSRYTSGTRAHQGSCAANIQDNSGDASSFYYTNGVDVDTPGYTQIKVDFWFYPRSMENGEDFWVRYYDGSQWHTVAAYVSGTDFVNDQFYHEVVYVNESSYTFPTNMKLKFQCDASGNYDDIYIDEIEVSAIGGGAPQPPGQASNPSPANGATNQSIDVDLSWTAGSGATSHNVYFSTDSSPAYVGNQTAATYDPGTLADNTAYYWRIDEKNTGGTTTGITWNFTTVVAPPDQASNPSPADGATNQSVDVDLTWTAGSGATSHDVYFGTTSPGTFQGNQTAATFDPGTLANSATYYWRIDEKNAGGTTTGAVWSFTTTAAPPPPPGQASNPSPADGATGQSVDVDISWTAGSDTTSHDIYFGTPGSPPFVQNQAGTTYDPGTLANDVTYYWQIDEVGAGGTTTGTVWSFTTEAAGPGPGNGTGLTGDYYDNIDFTNFALTRTDATVNFDWGSGSPDPAIGADSFSVQWTGQVQPLYSETYTFYTTSDDGVRLWINAQSIVDNWTDHGPTENSGTIALTAGTKYDIQMDFYENGGGAVAKLEWSSASQTREIIPQTQLYEAEAQPPAQASNPSPADAATDVSIDTSLGWSAGSGATSHDVYFGQDSTPDSGEFQGNQTGTTYDPGTLYNSATYYWRIDEKNAVGTTTGNVWSFTTEAATPAPGQASNPSPVDGATSQSVDVDISWTAGSDTTNHDVYFGTPTSPPFVQNQAGATYDPGTLANDTTYYWQIDEVGAGGTTTGAVWSFTTEAAAPPPGQASNPSPADGATGQSVDVDISWTAGSDTTSHDVYFGTPGSPPFVQNQAGTTYDPDTLANSATYYWRIDEKNAVGTTAGAVWSFTTAAGGGQTTLNPTADASSQSGGCEAASLSFSLWNHILMKFDLAGVPTPVTSAVLRLYYESSQALTIYIHDASTDSWDECGTLPTKGSTEMASVSATSAGWYEFDVTSYVDTEAAGDNVITFCITNDSDNWWSLSAREGPNPPELVVQYGGGGPPGQATNPIPDNGATGVSTTAMLNWTPGAGANSHDVYFGTPASPPFIQNQAVTTYNPGTLANGATYYWRIDEKNAQGTTTGNVWNFTTAAAVPPGQASNPSPANGATGVSTSVALSWTAGAGADSHDVYFGQDSTPDSGEFMGNQAGTTYDPGALAATTAYYWRIDEKNAYGTTTGPVWNFTTGSGAPAGMTVGCNFWRIDWGEGGWNHYFASGVDWSTTSNPWNPTFVSELQESKMTCLRFMDWVITNGSAVTSWSQRIPKTANHYYSGNIVPLLNSDGSSAGNGYGVAYEWQIDLCNRIGADIWVTVPHAADADYQHQLATLLYNNLNSNLKVHVEYSNECWNWGFYQATYCDEQSTAVGIRDLDVGEYCEPWWKYKIYASVRLFEQFENVFGVDSPRLVKAIGCQVGYNWGGYDYNHQIIGELACLNNSTINPNGVTVDAWAAAPYWGTSVGNIADMMLWAHNSLVGTGIKLLCYEGGSDNYSDPAGCTTVQLDPAQEQLYIDALNAIEPYCEGVFCQYCFVGDCWGLKKATGDPASNAPKWRGALQWINSHY